MTTRHFDAFFSPNVIALIGASTREGSVGAVLARNLLSGGFPGEIYFVNPHETRIQGRPCAHSLSGLAHTPDLAVIATPAASVYSLICELGDRGCRAAIVISAGDAQFRASLLEAARPRSIRIMGPNCLGFLSPVSGINASFAQLTPGAGSLALVTQSGAIATAVLDWAHGRGIGFSHILSLGDMIDIDFGDALDYLALDPHTSAILLYVEHITNAHKFLSAARIAARAKPVIVVKAGRSTGGAKAAQSHTGALAGADNVYDAAFRRAGMLRVGTLRELFDAAEILASGARPNDNRLMIVTNGGGLGVLAADALEQGGAKLATLSEPGRTALNAVLPRAWSHGNPIDILGDAYGARYQDALSVIVNEAESDATLVMNCPTGVADNNECAQTVAAAAKSSVKPILACWMGAASLEGPRQIFAKARIPLFEAPEDAVRAFGQLAEYTTNQRALLETPAPNREGPAPDANAASAIIAAVLAQSRSLLSATEAKAALTAYGVPVASDHLAPDPQAAAIEAARIGGHIALKIFSPDITHKSDVGGVALNIAPEMVEQAALLMMQRVREKAPTARLEGFTVAPMIDRPHAQELIIGASVDPTFGPIILFGQGGVSVEVNADTAIGLPPLNARLALDLIKRTRASRLLAGFRDRSPADVDAIVRTLLAVSDMISNHPEIVELDINPLLADSEGVLALDARMVVRSAAPGQRLAISPYPAALTQEIRLKSGAALKLRAIQPQDAPALLDLGAHAEAPDIRLRFGSPVRLDTVAGAARVSQLDYDREMAFAAIRNDDVIVGVAYVQFDPQIETGEFTLLVRTEQQRLGLGQAMLSALVGYAKSRGGRSLIGEIPTDNRAMLALAQCFGAKVQDHDGLLKRAIIPLQ